MSEDDIRDRVRSQYERFPYPAPKDNLDAFVRSGSCTAGCPAHHFHWFWPYRQPTQDLDILVAGCGTLQAAKLALHSPGARIVAMDISAGSLEATRKLLARHGIGNVELHELAIEEVASLGRSFDLIYATGVIHHLPDPLTGLRALRSVLRDEGSMYLMFYGRYGRHGIYLMQDFLRRIGVTASNVTEADISALRQLLLTLPPTHPLAGRRGILSHLDDPNELVDLFLHPQDRAYALPELLDLLGEADLELQKLLFRGHYLPQYSGLAQSPFLGRIMALPEEERWAVCELYRAAIVMHYLVACPTDRSGQSYRIDLDGPDWKALVPFRNPGVTILTTELPPGAVACLQWSAHSFPELRLPITDADLALFRRMDGKACIAELLPGMPSADDDRVRALIRALYNLDYLWLANPARAA